MPLAIFDLDNTLLAGDSDHRWGEFLCDTGVVDPKDFAASNDRFYADYQRGELDIDAYLRFALGPIAGQTPAQVASLQTQFLQDYIEPMLLPAAFELVDKHRKAGDRILIITATNTVVTGPIATRLGIEDLIGSDAELVDGRYTGAPTGVPSYREGKVARLETWLAEQGESMAGAWFYSDSHNDLPLLGAVDNPVAVDPDDTLREHALNAGWPVISLRT